MHGPSPRMLDVWRPGVLAGPDVFAQIRRSRPAVLHVQVEFGIYGGAVGLASLLSGLAASRALFRQRMVVTLHQVPSVHDLTADSLRRLGVRLPVWMARAALRAVVTVLSRLSDEMVVHAEIFRDRLRSEWGVSRPARVVPHGVTLDAQPAGSREPRLLLFGYLKWYKGIEVAVEAFRHLADEFPEWTLTVAGASMSRSYLEMLHGLARPLGAHVQFLGGVEEPVADDLFRRAAIVLFPYRMLFSASGPLARALGTATPCVISDALRPLCPSWPHWAPLQPDAWVRILRPMMRDRQRRAAAADLAAQHARASAWPVAAARTRAIYETVLSYE